MRAVAELFNRLDRSISGPALEGIEGVAPDMAVAIRNLMFVFEDLLNIEESGIREIINRADKKALTVALKGASEEIAIASSPTCRSAPASCCAKKWKCSVPCACAKSRRRSRTSWPLPASWKRKAITTGAGAGGLRCLSLHPRATRPRAASVASFWDGSPLDDLAPPTSPYLEDVARQAPAPPPPDVPVEEPRPSFAELEREAFTKGYAQGERAGAEASTPRRSHAQTPGADDRRARQLAFGTVAEDRASGR